MLWPALAGSTYLGAMRQPILLPLAPGFLEQLLEELVDLEAERGVLSPALHGLAIILACVSDPQQAEPSAG